MATGINIANGVVTYLNGLTLSQSFTATFEHWPEAEIKPDAGLLVSVFAGVRAGELVERARFVHTYAVFVVVQEKLSGTAAAQKTRATELVTLCEEIEAVLENQPIASHEMIEYDDATERSPFNIEQLREVGVFAAVSGYIYSD